MERVLVPTSNRHEVLFAIEVEFLMYCKAYLLVFDPRLPLQPPPCIKYQLLTSCEHKWYFK